ncbi:hypothetical protein BTHE68_40040 [Burkholderia sp. THE68]|uniref:hypothetical protein n=1 Tax=Burkholderia sp. THE68 TaxID=758782 RepID=UPI00131878D1|nr:hypothetical protein [Burkholderia sp. THE68]BBU30270.1 hypothetical protein BTHE68_40040 [Burkholderia sp. THE68]
MERDSTIQEGAERDATLKKIGQYIRDRNDASSTKELGTCWSSPREYHANYDLLFTEFDDLGLAADIRECQTEKSPGKDTNSVTAHGTECLKTSQLAQVYEVLKPYDCGSLKANEVCTATPVNIIIFTHGWHGSSRPDSWYTVGFRSFLESMATLEAEKARRGDTTKQRRVIGIEIAWRGDSLLFPDVLSVWDRKQAAETISLGAVQGMISRLHEFYLRNTCHIDNRNQMPGNLNRCGHARMLMIGHSFGALIDFRSLVGKVATGLRLDNTAQFAYSFGDLVVLVNPAFEGVRYDPTFTEAHWRTVFPQASTMGNDDSKQSQLPIIVTLQSKGDTATKFWFEAFRHVTTVFDNPQSDDEKIENVGAVGWVKRFETHELVQAANGDPTGSSKKRSLADRVDCRAKKWAVAQFAALNRDDVSIGDGMMLKFSGTGANKSPDNVLNPGSRIDGFPLWMVKVDSSLMKDHNDIWSSGMTEAILQLYWTSVLQADIVASGFTGEEARKLKIQQPICLVDAKL